MNFRKYEIDISKGIFKADGDDDHKRMIEALGLLNKRESNVSATPLSMPAAVSPTENGLKVLDLLEHFFRLKSHLTQATVLSYKTTMEEFADFLKNPLVSRVGVSDVTRYQNFLASKSNTTRTIDSKVGTIRAVFNFAIKQGYYFSSNPAQGRALLSRREKNKNGYGIFETDEIKTLFESSFLKESKTKDPDYYWSVVLGLITGCRISEITSLKKEQFKKTENGINYINIENSKTAAGTRKIPIGKEVLEAGLDEFIKGKKPEEQIFKYSLRLGKGSGNAVGKKFKRNLEEAKITREKLVFHSLRKFANNYFLNLKVDLETRCQYFGHELDNVNVQIYSKQLPVDELFERIERPQFGLILMTKIGAQ